MFYLQQGRLHWSYDKFCGHLINILRMWRHVLQVNTQELEYHHARRHADSFLHTPVYPLICDSVYPCFLSSLLCSSSDSKERDIHVWVLWNRMSNALRTVTDELGSCGGALAIDSLCVAALRNVVRILRGGKAKNVGPLLHLLGIC
jgi:hypothetical protein